MVRLPVFRGKRQKGQALLLILLVMSLVLTVVLSSVSKSVTDVEISKYEDNSIRAFDAAQAGIERAIVGSVTYGATVPLENQATFTPEETSDTSEKNKYNYPLNLLSGEPATIHFSGFKKDANGDFVPDCSGNLCNNASLNQLRVCWGQAGITASSNETPAVYLEFYYTNSILNFNSGDLSSVYRGYSIGIDPNSTRRASNHFSASLGASSNPHRCDDKYAFSYLFSGPSSPLNPPAGGALLFLKISLLYNTNIPQPVGVAASVASLKSQGSIITSTGNAGDVYRKLVLFQGYPEIPFEIGNAIYSKTGLSK